MSEKKELHSPPNVEERRYICGAQLEAISLGPRKGAPRYHRTLGPHPMQRRGQVTPMPWPACRDVPWARFVIRD